MSLLVADLDNPFHGFMVIRLDSVIDVIHLLDKTCLRHSKSAMGIDTSSILASVELPPEGRVNDQAAQWKGGRAQTLVSFRLRSYKDNFKKKAPTSEVYRAGSGKFNPKAQQKVLAMARLRTASLYPKSPDARGGPGSPAGGYIQSVSSAGGRLRSEGTGSLDDVEEVSAYDDLDEMERSVLSAGRSGSLLPH